MKLILCIVVSTLLVAAEDWDPGLSPGGFYTWLGRDIVSLGDLDGDGAGDFAVSSSREDPDGKGGDHGVVRAISGATGNVLWAHSEPGGFGDSLACLGDVNGDGLSDFAAGLMGFRGPAGFFVCSGADGAVLYAETDAEGESDGDGRVASVPDVTGDGIMDLVVGRPGHGKVNGTERAPSRVELRSGATGELVLRISDDRFAPMQDGPRARTIGAKVWGLPDLDGDGRGEIAFTLHRGLTWGEQVAVHVVSGRNAGPLFVIRPNRATDGDGPSLAVICDLDGDGVAELVVGSSEHHGYIYDGPGPDGGPPEWEEPLGEVHIHSGKDGSLLRQLEADAVSPKFGHAVASGADFDGDGVQDILVADHGDPWMYVDGACYAFSGADGGLLWRLGVGRFELQDFGASLAILEDLDGDQVADFAVGDMDAHPGSVNGGRVVVYSGSAGRELYRLPPPAEADELPGVSAGEALEPPPQDRPRWQSPHWTLELPDTAD